MIIIILLVFTIGIELTVLRHELWALTGVPWIYIFRFSVQPSSSCVYVFTFMFAQKTHFIDETKKNSFIAFGIVNASFCFYAYATCVCVWLWADKRGDKYRKLFLILYNDDSNTRIVSTHITSKSRLGIVLGHIHIMAKNKAALKHTIKYKLQRFHLTRINIIFSLLLHINTHTHTLTSACILNIFGFVWTKLSASKQQNLCYAFQFFPSSFRLRLVLFSAEFLTAKWTAWATKWKWKRTQNSHRLSFCSGIYAGAVVVEIGGKNESKI